MSKTDLSNLVVSSIVGMHHVCHDANVFQAGSSPVSTLVIRISGMTEYITDSGEVFISDPNHVVFIPAGCRCSMNASDNNESAWIDFTLDSAGNEPLSISSYEVQNTSELISIYNRMENKRMYRKPAYRNYSMAALYELFARVEVQSGACGVTPSSYRTVKPAVDYIEQHISDAALDNQAIAESAGISEVYLRRVFNSVFGITPARYITNIRIDKAKDLLNGGAESISKIAEAVGYKDVYYFSKVFKRVTGMTPSAYARSVNIMNI